MSSPPHDTTRLRLRLRRATRAKATCPRASQPALSPSLRDDLRAARALVQRAYTPFPRDEYGDCGQVWPSTTNAPEARWTVCSALLGAVPRNGASQRVNAMGRALAECLGLDRGTLSDLADWRDASPRTQAEVLAAFDDALKLLSR